MDPSAVDIPDGQEADTPREVYLDSSEGFEHLEGFIPTDALSALSAEVDRLVEEVKTVNPFESAWQTPKTDSSSVLKQQYERTVATALAQAPDFAQKYPAIQAAIDAIKKYSGLDTLEELNVNRYTPGTQIPPHNDRMKLDKIEDVFCIEVSGNGVVRIWPDQATEGWFDTGSGDDANFEMKPGDVSRLSAIRIERDIDMDQTRFSVGTDVTTHTSEYVSRAHSAENPYDTDRVILLVGVSKPWQRLSNN